MIGSTRSLMVARDRLFPRPRANYFAVAHQCSYVSVVEGVDLAQNLETPAPRQQMPA